MACEASPRTTSKLSEAPRSPPTPRSCRSVLDHWVTKRRSGALPTVAVQMPAGRVWRSSQKGKMLSGQGPRGEGRVGPRRGRRREADRAVDAHPHRGPLRPVEAEGEGQRDRGGPVGEGGEEVLRAREVAGVDEPERRGAPGVVARGERAGRPRRPVAGRDADGRARRAGDPPEGAHVARVAGDALGARDAVARAVADAAGRRRTSPRGAPPRRGTGPRRCTGR